MLSRVLTDVCFSSYRLDSPRNRDGRAIIAAFIFFTIYFFPFFSLSLFNRARQTPKKNKRKLILRWDAPWTIEIDHRTGMVPSHVTRRNILHVHDTGQADRAAPLHVNLFGPRDLCLNI